jgi:hypothetical protein
MIGPVLAVLVAIAHQAGGDRVPVGLVADQDATEVLASFRVERLEDGPETYIRHDESPCLSREASLERTVRC